MRFLPALVVFLFSCRSVQIQRAWEAELRWLQLAQADTLVDIGCGDGVVSRSLQQALPQLFVVLEDVRLCSESDVTDSLPIAWRTVPGSAPPRHFRYVAGAPDTIPLPSATYRHVLLRKTFHEFTNRPAMLRELQRILTPDGVLTVVEFLPRRQKRDPFCGMPYLTRQELLTAFSSFRLIADTQLRYGPDRAVLLRFQLPDSR